MDWSRMHEHLARQYGFVAVRDACGDSEARSWRRRATTEGWDRRARGLYGQAWTECPERRAARALLWVGPPAVLTGWSTLWLAGLRPNLPGRVQVLTDHRRRVRRLDGLRLSRTRHFEHVAAFTRSGLVSASVNWALTDLAGSTPPNTLRGLLIDALQQQLVDVVGLHELLQLRRRLRGGGVLRRLLSELSTEQVDSVLESALRGRVRAEQLPPPAPSPVPVRCGDGRVVHVDIGWPSATVGLDCHGAGFHSSRAALDNDAVRANHLLGTPWKVFVATWKHVHDDVAWAVLAGQLRAALAAPPH